MTKATAEKVVAELARAGKDFYHTHDKGQGHKILVLDEPSGIWKNYENNQEVQLEHP